jgi:hypothetical protein
MWANETAGWAFAVTYLFLEAGASGLGLVQGVREIIPQPAQADNDYSSDTTKILTPVGMTDVAELFAAQTGRLLPS